MDTLYIVVGVIIVVAIISYAVTIIANSPTPGEKPKDEYKPLFDFVREQAYQYGKCTFCGQSNPSLAHFCRRCGRRLLQ